MYNSGLKEKILLKRGDEGGNVIIVFHIFNGTTGYRPGRRFAAAAAAERAAGPNGRLLGQRAAAKD